FKEAGSSATDYVTDVTDVTDRRKKEQGKNQTGIRNKLISVFELLFPNVYYQIPLLSGRKHRLTTDN
ncbi:MAG: hypothetical protein KY448_13175, partial [Cyanobacteria bacterium 0813]|nr:hypothetical protein [Cyanobacteria bacterium 0813]